MSDQEPKQNPLKVTKPASKPAPRKLIVGDAAAIAYAQSQAPTTSQQDSAPVATPAEPANPQEPAPQADPVQTATPVLQVQAPAQQDPAPVATPAEPASPQEPAPQAAPVQVAAPVLQVQAPVQQSPVAQATPVQTAPVLQAQAPPQQAPAPTANTPLAVPGSNGALQRKKSGMSNAAKGVIAAVLTVSVIIAGIVYFGKKQQKAKEEQLNKITSQFSDPTNPPNEILINGYQVDLLLDKLTTLGTTGEKQRPTLQQALYIAKATDGTDIDLEIAKYAVKDGIDGGLREDLFEVLGARANPSCLDQLIEFASKTNDPNAGRSALRATTKMATTDNFESLLAIIVRTKNSSIKSAAVDSLTGVIQKSEKPESYIQAILTNHQNAPDENAKMALLRLAGSAGGEAAATLVSEALAGESDTMKAAAINALENWPDDSQFETLLEYTGQESNSTLRRTGFSALTKFLRNNQKLEEETRSLLWGDVAGIATGTSEQVEVVNAMVRESGDWADDILDTFVEHGDTDKVTFAAERAKEIFAENRKRAERAGASE